MSVDELLTALCLVRARVEDGTANPIFPLVDVFGAMGDNKAESKRQLAVYRALVGAGFYLGATSIYGQLAAIDRALETAAPPPPEKGGA